MTSRLQRLQMYCLNGKPVPREWNIIFSRFLFSSSVMRLALTIRSSSFLLSQKTSPVSYLIALNLSFFSTRRVPSSSSSSEIYLSMTLTTWANLSATYWRAYLFRLSSGL